MPHASCPCRHSGRSGIRQAPQIINPTIENRIPLVHTVGPMRFIKGCRVRFVTMTMVILILFTLGAFAQQVSSSDPREQLVLANRILAM